MSEETKPSVSARYNDPSADVVLVSQDGMRFRVHSYQLKTHSPGSVIRDMLVAPRIGNAPASITDDRSVTADEIPLDLDSDHLTLFLGLMRTGRDVEIWLRRYEHLSRAVAPTLQTQEGSWKAFCLAAHLNDPYLLQMTTFKLRVTDLVRNGADGYRSKFFFPIKHLTLEQWEKCPPAKALALFQALSERFSVEHRDFIRWNEVAERLASECHLNL